MSLKTTLKTETAFVYNKYFSYPIILIFLFLNVFLPFYLRSVFAFIFGIYLKLFWNNKLSHENGFFYVFVLSVFVIETIIILGLNVLKTFVVLALFYIGYKYAKKIKGLF